MDNDNRITNIHALLDGVDEAWSPRVVASVNEYEIKVSNVEGDYAAHAHVETDEFFLVLAGEFSLRLADGNVTLRAGDVYTVPRGVVHEPHAVPGTRILMVEPRGTLSGGDPPRAA